MCGSIEDSVVAGVIIYAAAAVFLLSGSKEYIWLGAVLLVTGTIQFLDALIWIFRKFNLPTKPIAQYGILIILMLELITVYGGYVYYSGERIPLYEILLLIAIIVMGGLWILKCKDTTVTRDGYLKWCNVNIPFIEKIIFLSFLLFPVLYFPDMAQKILFLVFACGTWLYNFNHEAFGSRWCYSVSIYAVIAVLLYFLGKDF
jgi:hypothetical protein